MDVSIHIDALETHGELLASAAERTDFESVLPTCPEWTLRDLLEHVGTVHRWADSYVRSGRSEMMTDDEEEAFFRDIRPDGSVDLVDWFRSGHRALCHALSDAPPDLGCWFFLPSPSPLAFWARRQAHETTIHRYDAESVSRQFTPVDPALASDGVDELLRGFASRGRKLLRDPAQTMCLRATDTGDSWHVTLGPDLVTVVDPSEDRLLNGKEPDCTVSATASDLYLGLWNRIPTSSLESTGEPDVLTGFSDSLKIRWT